MSRISDIQEATKVPGSYVTSKEFGDYLNKRAGGDGLLNDSEMGNVLSDMQFKEPQQQQDIIKAYKDRFGNHDINVKDVVQTFEESTGSVKGNGISTGITFETSFLSGKVADSKQTTFGAAYYHLDDANSEFDSESPSIVGTISKISNLSVATAMFQNIAAKDNQDGKTEKPKLDINTD